MSGEGLLHQKARKASAQLIVDFEGLAEKLKNQGETVFPSIVYLSDLKEIIEEMTQDFQTVDKGLRQAANYIHSIWHENSEIHPGTVSFTLHGERLALDFQNLRDGIKIIERWLGGTKQK